MNALLNMLQENRMKRIASRLCKTQQNTKSGFFLNFPFSSFFEVFFIDIPRSLFSKNTFLVSRGNVQFKYEVVRDDISC